MFLGISSILLACFLWSLVFVIPIFLESFHPLEIALGRYFVYGFISFIYVLLKKRDLFSRQYSPYWKKASYLAFLSTILCYTATLSNIQLSGPTIATLIFGMVPISIALIGNWHQKEIPASKLAFPLFLIMLGIFFAKFKEVDAPPVSLTMSLLGIFLGLIGLGAWTWYAVANSNFLKKQEDLSIGNWALMMGTVTFFLVLVFTIFLSPFSDGLFKYLTPSPEIKIFFLGCLLLGVLSTWLSFFFWNYGCKRVPISLSGQLMVFEILFALFLIYLIEHRLPSPWELIGMFCMITGVFISLKKIKYPSSNK